MNYQIIRQANEIVSNVCLHRWASTLGQIHSEVSQALMAAHEKSNAKSSAAHGLLLHPEGSFPKLTNAKKLHDILVA